MSIRVANEKQIIAALDKIYLEASKADTITIKNINVLAMITEFHSKIDLATSAFSNLLTCLVSNVCDNKVDPRYHRKPGKSEEVGEMPPPPYGSDYFSGRSISEKIIYPWMASKGYRCAKSGWQTRTFERPRPYTKDYPENIDYVKTEFLGLLDIAATTQNMSFEIIKAFFILENKVRLERENLNVALDSSIKDDALILDIIHKFELHFNVQDSARLPVIAIYSLYKLVLGNISKYSNYVLQELASHEAADLRTGSIGDIEIANEEGIIVEAIEVKHNIPIDSIILRKAVEKIIQSKVRRYYILTTHSSCSVIDQDCINEIRSIYKKHGCQIIINGVIPTMKYYLRLFESPVKILSIYSEYLRKDRKIKNHHLQEWLKILNE